MGSARKQVGQHPSKNANGMKSQRIGTEVDTSGDRASGELNFMIGQPA
jgi:hypothetical protein